MIKLSDFARQQGVTDRQVQRLINKYATELEGHFERRGQNGTWLSDSACELLRSKMKSKPVAVFEVDPRVIELQAENNKLHEKLSEVYEKLTEAKESQMHLQLQLAEKAAEQRFLSEKIQTYEDIAEINRQEADRAKAEAATLRSELDRLKNRGFFARLFNRE